MLKRVFVGFVLVVAVVHGQSLRQLDRELLESSPSVSDAGALQVLDYHFRVAGGPEFFSGVAGIELIGRRTVDLEEQRFRIVAAPERRLCLELYPISEDAVVKQVRYLRGQELTIVEPADFPPFVQEMSGRAADDFWRSWSPFFPIGWDDGDCRYSYLGRVQNSSVYGVRTHLPSGRVVDRYFESEHYLCVRSDWREIHRGTIVKRSFLVKRLQQVQGVWFPAIAEFRLSDDLSETVRIERVRFLESVDDEWFVSPVRMERVDLEADDL